jgi:Rrf2 family protein
VPAIAEAQAIPSRFLEQILAELRREGLVVARRGVGGGYALASEPRDVTLGRIMRLVDGPLDPVDCPDGNGKATCPMASGCPFQPMWNRMRDAIAEIVDETTLQDLLDSQASQASAVLAYCI